MGTANVMPNGIAGKYFAVNLLQLDCKLAGRRRASKTLHLSAIRLRKWSLLRFARYRV